MQPHLDWSVPLVLVLVVAGCRSSGTSARWQLRFFLWYGHDSVLGFFQPGPLLRGAFLTPTHLDKQSREEPEASGPPSKKHFSLCVK